MATVRASGELAQGQMTSALSPLVWKTFRKASQEEMDPDERRRQTIKAVPTRVLSKTSWEGWNLLPQCEILQWKYKRGTMKSYLKEVQQNVLNLSEKWSCFAVKLFLRRTKASVCLKQIKTGFSTYILGYFSPVGASIGVKAPTKMLRINPIPINKHIFMSDLITTVLRWIRININWSIWPITIMFCSHLKGLSVRSFHH